VPLAVDVWPGVVGILLGDPGRKVAAFHPQFVKDAHLTKRSQTIPATSSTMRECQHIHYVVVLEARADWDIRFQVAQTGK
jgi:hypothetical protein